MLCMKIDIILVYHNSNLICFQCDLAKLIDCKQTDTLFKYQSIIHDWWGSKNLCCIDCVFFDFHNRALWISVYIYSEQKSSIISVILKRSPENCYNRYEQLNSLDRWYTTVCTYNCHIVDCHANLYELKLL